MYFWQVADLELRNKDRKDIVHQLTSDLAKQKDGKHTSTCRYKISRPTDTHVNSHLRS